jgi:hypothetical protein
VGTAKSRVFRARRQLQTWLAGEEHSAPAQELTQSQRNERRHETRITSGFLGEARSAV